MRIFSLIMLTLFLVSCNKPDPNPELKDPIYGDLNSTLGSAKQALEAEKKAYEGFVQELKDVVPQTGQIKFAQKRVFESQAKINKLQQEVQYLELKILARKEEAVSSYATAFSKDEPWPNPSEWSAYETQKKLRSAKRDWDSRTRVKDFNSGGKTKAPAQGEGKAEGGH